MHNGVMGAGIALSIKQQYPKVWRTYRKEYEEKGLFVGECQFVDINSNLTVVNAITQEHFGRNKDTVYVSYEGIAKCFITISKFIEQKKNELTELNPGHCIIIYLDFPLIGCGLGGGSFEIISKIIDECVPDELAEKRLFIR